MCPRGASYELATSALSNGVGCKTVISQLSEPAMSALMVNVRIKPKRNQKVSVQEPGHLSSSCSTARTSAAVISRRPLETLRPDTAFRLERIDGRFASVERRSRRLIACEIEISSACANPLPMAYKSSSKLTVSRINAPWCIGASLSTKNVTITNHH